MSVSEKKILNPVSNSREITKRAKHYGFSSVKVTEAGIQNLIKVLFITASLAKLQLAAALLQ